MNSHLAISRLALAVLCVSTLNYGAYAADKDLLDVLLENGAITRAQYDDLLKKDEIVIEDVLQPDGDEVTEVDVAATGAANVDAGVRSAIEEEVARQIESESQVKASYTSSGFRLETRDGNWQTNLQWRA